MELTFVSPYTGLGTDDHRMLKVYCAATDQTMRAVREEAMAKHLASRPGIDAVASLISTVREAIAEAEAPKQLKNGKK
jgi:hypothetical protein